MTKYEREEDPSPPVAGDTGTPTKLIPVRWLDRSTVVEVTKGKFACVEVERHLTKPKPGALFPTAGEARAAPETQRTAIPARRSTITFADDVTAEFDPQRPAAKPGPGQEPTTAIIVRWPGAPAVVEVSPGKFTRVEVDRDRRSPTAGSLFDSPVVARNATEARTVLPPFPEPVEALFPGNVSVWFLTRRRASASSRVPLSVLGQEGLMAVELLHPTEGGDRTWVGVKVAADKETPLDATHARAHTSEGAALASPDDAVTLPKRLGRYSAAVVSPDDDTLIACTIVLRNAATARSLEPPAVDALVVYVVDDDATDPGNAELNIRGPSALVRLATDHVLAVDGIDRSALELDEDHPAGHAQCAVHNRSRAAIDQAVAAILQLRGGAQPAEAEAEAEATDVVDPGVPVVPAAQSTRELHRP